MATKADLIKMLEVFADDEEVNFKVTAMEPQYTITMIVPDSAKPVNGDSVPTEVVDAPVVEEKAVADEIAD